MPAFSSITLYRLDINLRSSVILGYVGAGGIGFLLEEDIEGLNFKHAVGIVLVIFVLIVLMEYVSALIRRSLIGEDAPAISGRPGYKRRAARPLPRWLGALVPGQRPVLRSPNGYGQRTDSGKDLVPDHGSVPGQQARRVPPP